MQRNDLLLFVVYIYTEYIGGTFALVQGFFASYVQGSFAKYINQTYAGLFFQTFTGLFCWIQLSYLLLFVNVNLRVSTHRKGGCALKSSRAVIFLECIHVGRISACVFLIHLSPTNMNVSYVSLLSYAQKKNVTHCLFALSQVTVSSNVSREMALR